MKRAHQAHTAGHDATCRAGNDERLQRRAARHWEWVGRRGSLPPAEQSPTGSPDTELIAAHLCLISTTAPNTCRAASYVLFSVWVTFASGYQAVYPALILVLAGIVLYAFLNARREHLGQIPEPADNPPGDTAMLAPADTQRERAAGKGEM